VNKSVTGCRISEKDDYDGDFILQDLYIKHFNKFF
jgi:hypothetical protein